MTATTINEGEYPTIKLLITISSNYLYFEEHNLPTGSGILDFLEEIIKIFYSAFRMPNIFDNMIAILEKYSTNLEEIVDERTSQLREEQKKTEELLHQMLPV